MSQMGYCRAGLGKELRLKARNLFGAARTEALGKAIDDAATRLAHIAAFPVHRDEPPMFYIGHGDRRWSASDRADRPVSQQPQRPVSRRAVCATKPFEFTLLEAIEAIDRGDMTPLELMDSLIGRIDQLDRKIGAWALVDCDRARAEARQCTDELARHAKRGPLHGIPFGAKDIFYTQGVPTEAGSELCKGFIPSYDATAVARLKEAGGILLGKLETSELAMANPPTTRNPWNLRKMPGGSSSGSAAAVSAQMVPVALGTQTGGSLLRPASYCGVVGLKPTFGRVSLYGVMPCSWTQDHVGVIARTVEDAALLLQIMAGYDPNDFNSACEPVPAYVVAIEQPPRIAVVDGYFADMADSEVTRMIAATRDRLAGAGALIEEAKLPASFGAIHAAGWTIMRLETASVHGDLYEEKASLYREGTRREIEIGLLIPGSLYLRALKIRRQFQREMKAFLERCDILLTPTTPTPAPELGQAAGEPIFQLPWSTSGFPAITLPAGFSGSGLPLGIQLVGAPFAEESLLRAAAWCEEVIGRAPAPGDPDRPSRPQAGAD